MPANYSMSSNAEFAAGHTPLSNSGRGNDNSLTLNDSASTADQGLAATSARWNTEAGTGYTPHSVLAGLPGMSGNGMSAAEAERLLPGGRTMPSPNGEGQDTYGSSSELGMLYGSD